MAAERMLIINPITISLFMRIAWIFKGASTNLTNTFFHLLFFKKFFDSHNLTFPNKIAAEAAKCSYSQCPTSSWCITLVV